MTLHLGFPLGIHRLRQQRKLENWESTAFSPPPCLGKQRRWCLSIVAMLTPPRLASIWCPGEGKGVKMHLWLGGFYKPTCSHYILHNYRNLPSFDSRLSLFESLRWSFPLPSLNTEDTGLRTRQSNGLENEILLSFVTWTSHKTQLSPPRWTPSLLCTQSTLKHCMTRQRADPRGQSWEGSPPLSPSVGPTFMFCPRIWVFPPPQTTSSSLTEDSRVRYRTTM